MGERERGREGERERGREGEREHLLTEDECFESFLVLRVALADLVKYKKSSSSKVSNAAAAAAALPQK